MKTEEWLEIDKFERMQSGVGEVAVSRYMPGTDRLAIRLYGTDWDFGQLTLHLVDERAEPEEGMGPKFICYPMDLAMHPERGIVNTRIVSAAPEMDARSYARTVGERARMTTAVLRDAVRQALDDDGPVGEFWSDRRIPLEPLYYFRSGCTRLEPEEVGIHPERVIEGDWDDVPRLLEETVPVRVAAGAREEFDPVGPLIETVRELTPSFIDHESYIDTWGFAEDQLLDDAERAA